jgi:hypothetical protein
MHCFQKLTNSSQYAEACFESKAFVEKNKYSTQIIEKVVVYDGYEMMLKVVKSGSSSKPCPAFLFVSDTADSFDNSGNSRQVALILATLSGFTAVEVSPKSLTTNHECIFLAYAALKWIGEHGLELQIDTAKIALIGLHSGGQVSAVITLMAAADRWPKLKLQVLMLPELLMHERYEPGYKPDINGQWEDTRAIYATPLETSFRGLTYLPPTVIHTQDTRHYNFEIDYYGCKLRDAGAPVKIIHYNKVTESDTAQIDYTLQIPWHMLSDAANTLKLHLGEYI